jgi:tripartite-type tricarboxylate transporter receptor subunit TctC
MKSSKHFLLRRTAVATLLLSASAAAWTQPQPFPSHLIRLIVPSTAGGAADVLARIMAPDMSATLGQQVVVENRPGAGNIIGTETVAKAAPDGYTLLLAINNHVINATLYKNLHFDPIKDFAPISLLATTPHMLVVNPSSGITSVQDLIAKAKANPGKLNYSSAGNGTAAQFAAELFKMTAGVDITHVPYNGVTPAVTDVMSGQVQMMFPSPLSVLPQVRTGRLKALAVTTPTRSKSLPDLPTMQESGLKGYEFSSWYGLLAPRGTPPEVIAALNKAALHALATPAVMKRLSDDATDAAGDTPEQFQQFINDEFDRYTKLVKAIGLKVE